MTKRYIITAGDNSTDCGRVGQSDSILGAKRIGRAYVREALPNGCGGYRVIDNITGQHVGGGQRSIRTGLDWVESFA